MDLHIKIWNLLPQKFQVPRYSGAFPNLSWVFDLNSSCSLHSLQFETSQFCKKKFFKIQNDSRFQILGLTFLWR